MAFDPTGKSAFDARSQWNEAIGHTIEDCRLNRVASNYDAWRRSVWSLIDLGRTFVDEQKIQPIMQNLEQAHRMILRYQALERFRDVRATGMRKKIEYDIERCLSDAQTMATRAMAAKGMISPIKQDEGDITDDTIAEEMGM